MHLSFARIATLAGLMCLGLLVSLPARAQAANECSVESLTASVPYFSERMERAAAAPSATVSFRHQDDERIVISFRPQVTVSSIRSTRLQYADTMRQSVERTFLSAGIPASSIGVSVEPYDPMSARGEAIDNEKGVLYFHSIVAISPFCSVVMDATAPSSAPLASRVREVRQAADLLFTKASARMEPLVFMEDNSAPSGNFAWLAGLAAPLLLAGVLMFVLRGVLPEKAPGQAVYTVVSLSMIAMLGNIGVALFAKAYLMVPMEIVFALGTAVLVCAASVLSRSRDFLIFAISATFAVAVVYGIYGAFGWAQELIPTIASAAAIAVLSVLALTSWGRSGGLLAR
mgnify:CR=1 FL=1